MHPQKRWFSRKKKYFSSKFSNSLNIKNNFFSS